MTSITLTETIRELDARESDGIAVSLLWDPRPTRSSSTSSIAARSSHCG